MSTRGVHGFRLGDEYKLTYSHSADPDFLGKRTLLYVRSHTLGEMLEIFKRIELVNEEERPTHAQIAEVHRWWPSDELFIGSGVRWCDLLYVAKENLFLYDFLLREVEAPCWMYDASEALQDVLTSCAYVLDLREELLEFYVMGDPLKLYPFTLIRKDMDEVLKDMKRVWEEVEG